MLPNEGELMNLTIIGAGAIGGTIGAHMIRAGHDVLFCDADAAHVREINERGLTIEGPVENFTVRARALLPQDLPEKLGNIAIAVKSHQTKSAVELIRGKLSNDSFVVSFQNGLTASEISSVVGAEKVLVSFVNFGADYLAPGRIMQGNIGTFKVGELSTDEITPRVLELVAALPYAEPTSNILGYLWGKEAYGAMLYAGATSDMSIADHLESPRFRDLMIAIAREVLAQAPVKPEGFDGFDPHDLDNSLDRLAKFNRQSAKTHSGIYRDLTVRKRKTEVDDLLRDLNGPFTNHVGALIQSIERGERVCEIENLELLATYERALRLGNPINAISRMIPAPSRAFEGPLKGIAIAVKDIVDVKGVPRGNGNPIDMSGPAAFDDAPVIKKLRDLAADIFATTTLLEYAAGATHPEVPEAMNPFDYSKTAGGSSGGSAAIVGAGICDVAIGTDTGGSIRIPAHYCGVVGYKPSHNTISLEGVTPLSPTFDHVGLLAKDVSTTSKIISNLQPEIGEKKAINIRDLRIGIIPEHFLVNELESDVKSAISKVIERLKSAGATIVELDSSIMKELDKTFEHILLYESWQVHGERITNNPNHYGAETLRFLKLGGSVTKIQYEEALSRRKNLLQEYQSIYSLIDLILTPACPFVAPSTTPPMDTPMGAAEGIYTALFNNTGEPAIVIPCGRSSSGLPIGVQIATKFGSDSTLLSIAAKLEELLTQS